MTFSISTSIKNYVPRAVPYDERFLLRSSLWFQDDELRHQIMASSVTKEQQRAWFDNLHKFPDYHIRGVELESVPIGAFGIKVIGHKLGEYWGFIAEKEYRGSGIGKWMLQQAVDLGQSLGLEKIILKVLDNNIIALKLYQSFGFVIQSQEANILWMYLDV